MTEIPTVAPPDPNPRTPKNQIPKGACDCHFHVFDGPSRQIPERSYSAPTAALDDYRVVQTALGLDRSVIVQPSIYGLDNRTTLQSLPDDGSMKAVVVVNDQTSQDELTTLAQNGAVGARVNMLFSNGARVDSLAAFAGKLSDIGWHLQILTDVATQPDLMQSVTSLAVPVVFDHMGHVQTHNGINDPGFQSLLKALDSGKSG